MSRKKSTNFVPLPEYIFAYGSNLDPVQMKHRCPSAEPAGVLVLHGFFLAFTGTRGVATIVEGKDEYQVPGLLWKVSPEDLKEMDRYEGVPHSYVACDFDHEGRRIRAYVHAGKAKSQTLPSEDYLLKLVRAYKQHGWSLDDLEQAVLDAAGM